jgi:hypothetical protein
MGHAQGSQGSALETLRGVNRALCGATRVRLIVGNDGTDRATMHVAEDFAPFPCKTNHMRETYWLRSTRYPAK